MLSKKRTLIQFIRTIISKHVHTNLSVNEISNIDLTYEQEVNLASFSRSSLFAYQVILYIHVMLYAGVKYKGHVRNENIPDSSPIRHKNSYTDPAVCSYIMDIRQTFHNNVVGGRNEQPSTKLDK